MGVFYFAAHRVDARFVHGHVGTYEQYMGWAFTLFSLSIVCYLFSIIVALVATYQLLRKSEDHLGMPVRELAPLYNSHMSSSAI
ncbi:unnamed protein product [Enterobius vermicularis]|uniref:Transmembrane 9 superfamily member n=1 Tax=Enterobius vermicularis TaxID=51028 RepID=A0A0N4UTT8_ENTVE|nr:unnamed protein product [Enterobius vermicularis]